MKTIKAETIDNIVDKIVTNNNPEKIILFDSYTTDNYDSNSDIDLLVIIKSDKPRHKRGREIRKSLRGMGVPIDIVVFTPEEVKKYKNVTNSIINIAVKEGVVLYERKGKWLLKYAVAQQIVSEILI